MSKGDKKNGRVRPNGKLRPIGGNGATSTPNETSTTIRGPLDVSHALAGRRILITGATGFVGKVALSMLLHRYPGLGKVFVLVRPGTGGTAEARFFDKVAQSRPFDPLRARCGASFDSFLRDKCAPIAGDVVDPNLGLSAPDLERLEGLDLVLNCAGLVDFNPSLELALAVNAEGARNAAVLCERIGASLAHVSTCFVAGNRDGVVFEDEEIRGYFPRREGVAGRPKQVPLDARDFDLEAEIADCRRRIAQVRDAAEDRTLLSEFRRRGAERLRAEGRDPDDEKGLRLATGREKRLWVSQQLVELGMDRARHWGWPNTYTFTKSLGEQLIVASGCRWAIARPSIVESALRYPFPGWNEGFTTSAPLTFLALKGHRSYPAAEKAVLDVVPVDLIAAGLIAVAADLIDRPCLSPSPRLRGGSRGEGPSPRSLAPSPSPSPPLGERETTPDESESPERGARGAGEESRQGLVYHLASGDLNPFWVRRCIELVGIYQRRFFRRREEGSKVLNWVLSHLEPYAVSRRHYETFSAPALARLTRAASRLVREHTPSWGAPRLSALAGGVANQLDEIESQLEKMRALFELYLPFTWDNRYVFRCARVRDLYARLTPADRERIPWDPERIDWRSYWLDVHMKGMEEWVFPGLEEESRKKVHSVRAHRDLLELVESACETWKNRVALRMSGQRKERFTYGELRAWSDRVARFLLAGGIARNDRVVLACENRPEWAVAYFGILKAGAVAVPVDPELSAAEIANLCRTAGARLALLSEAAAARLAALPGDLAAAGAPTRIAELGEAFTGGPPLPLTRSASADDVASLIFTSGTTGAPKGVMLTHRNFTSLVARLAATFNLGPGDGLLSVLPLHHTFEFTCGLLVPLSRGAEVEYLDEVTADSLGDALEEGRVTAMIGVPALWSLLHRRVTQELAARPGVVEQAFRQLMALSGGARDRWALNLGKLLFWPVHRKLGGRLRILVSGGSALSPDVQRAFHELGFDLYEGYGLTEAAPVLSVSAPGGADPPSGNVGKALPGIEIRIADPDEHGVGEVLARGPNVMLGYWKATTGAPQVDREATDAVLRDGWLHTGDLGRLDAEGRLTLVGREKDVIIDADGRNVHPDEVEQLYQEPELVQELSAVGLPEGDSEKVALLLVPRYEGRDRAEVRRRIEDHLRTVSASLPFHKRAKVWHLTDQELPKTATRKVKRKLVVEELKRLEAAAHRGRKARQSAQRGGDGWLLDLLAEISRRPRTEVTNQSLLAGDLGFDSLMLTELASALEEAGVPTHLVEDLSSLQTVGELSRLAAGSHRAEERRESRRETGAPGEIPVPSPVAALGRQVLKVAQQTLYRQAYATEVRGEAFIPRDRNFLVVANHASHLDMGLVKVALGDAGEKLAALAAADYFFDTPLKRAYFENFTNLIPMERSGSVRRSLRAAEEALRRGFNVLIFPEGTRSRDGAMASFKPTAGYLALTCGVDVLPVYLHGTHEALPKGSFLPRRAKLKVAIGQPLRIDELRMRTLSLPKGEAHRFVTRIMEEAVRSLRDATVSTIPSPPQGERARVRGPDRDSTAPHPNPLPASGEREEGIATPTPTATPTPGEGTPPQALAKKREDA